LHKNIIAHHLALRALLLIKEEIEFKTPLLSEEGVWGW